MSSTGAAERPRVMKLVFPLASPHRALQDECVRPVLQATLSNLVELKVLDVARDDRRMCVTNVSDERAFLLKLWQCVQGSHHPSLCGVKARDDLRDLIAIR